VIAYTYPLLSVFWTILWFFAFVFYIWLLVAIFTDIFRSRDMGGVAKTLWVIFVLFVPLLGILVYLIARGGKMHEREAQAAQQQQQEFDSYVRNAAGSDGSAADQLSKLAALKDKGVITNEEFEAQKAKILS